MRIGILMLMMVHKLKSKLIEFYILYIEKLFVRKPKNWAKSAYNKYIHFHADWS